MQPRPTTEADLAYWSALNPRPATFGPPLGSEDVAPCPAIVTTDDMASGHDVVRVPWQLDEIELVHLAKGGTLWLSMWGGLPPHMLEVQEPA